MSHHYSHAQSWPASQASQSWGTSSSLAANQSPPPSHSARVAKPAIYASSDATQYSFGIPSHLSWAPSSHPDASSAWGSSAGTLVNAPTLNQGAAWPGPMPLSAPHVYSLSSSSSSSSTVVRDHVVAINDPRWGAPAPPAPRLHPLMEAGRFWCDFKYPPSMTPATVNFNPYMGDIAFSPPLAHICVQFYDNPRWAVRIASPQPLTIFAILGEVYNFLQRKETSEDPQMTLPRHDMRAQSRDRNASPHSFHGGLRRIDTLGRRRVFYGLSISGSGQNTWIVRLCEPSQ